MRTFIGIGFDSNVRKSLEELSESLKKFATRGRWKRTDNFHLTLKFLGEINPALVGPMAKSLEEVACFGRFTLRPGKLGYFAGKGCIRVLWLGIEGESDKLFSLQKEVDRIMEREGFPPEKRPYRPHITLAQDLFTDLGFDALQKQAECFRHPEIRVDRITIFSSEQIAGRRVYTPVAEIPLK